MTPQDIAGVLSRYFIVGFFLPAFFGLVVYSQSVTDDFLPNVYERHEGIQIALLGGGALFGGLLLLGLNYQVMRLFEGYPLRDLRHAPVLRKVHALLLGRQRRRFDRLRNLRDGSDASEETRTLAAWRLESHFPDTPERLLPTRFGNVVKAFELHSWRRWGLDSIPAWPRIELLLETEQRELEANARSEIAFFLNGALMALGIGVAVIADEVFNHPVDGWYWLWAYAVPFGLAYALYFAGASAAIRWGNVVRSIFDVQRLSLYEKLGVRRPAHFSDERDFVAPAVNRTLLYGHPLPDQLRAPEDVPTEEEEQEEE
jgi:hypothetical protein